MPRYFFDVYDGETSVADLEGLVVEDIDTACDMAVDILPDIARDVLPGGERRDMMVQVTDHLGMPVLRAILSMRVEWMVGRLAMNRITTSLGVGRQEPPLLADNS